MGDEHTTHPNASNPTQNQQRLTVHDAARQFGISEDAVRMRIKRGTLAAEREGGRLYVLLTPDPTTEPTDRTGELIDELKDRVRSLEDQLGAEREANRENRRLLAAALERIPPQLEAPSEPRESPETATEGEAEPQEELRRGFWARLFGG